MSNFTALNGMQQMMLRWEEFRPLNAVHAVSLSSSAAFSEIQNSAIEATKSLRLGPVEICRGRKSIRWHRESSQLSEYLVPRFDEGGNWMKTYQHITDELNLPFHSDVHWPFRLTYMADAGGSPALIMTYQHAVLDSRSVSLVLREILRNLRSSRQTHRDAVSDSDHLGPSAIPSTPKGLLRRTVEAVEESIHGSRQFLRRHAESAAARIVCPVPHVAVKLDAVKNTAKTLGVRIQTLFLAAIFEALGIVLREELQAGLWRRTVSIHTPVDMRSEVSDLPVDTLGQFLGSVASRLALHDRIQFADIVRAVAMQMDAQRIRRNAVDILSKMETMARVWDAVPRSWNRRLSPALFSAMAVGTNVNLNSFFHEEISSGQIVSYLRFTGTGILVPMMIGLTTLGDQIFLTLTCHENSFSTGELDLLLDHVAFRLSGHTGVHEPPRRPVASTIPDRWLSTQLAGV
jgi:hypothetical protein